MSEKASEAADKVVRPAKGAVGQKSVADKMKDAGESTKGAINDIGSKAADAGKDALKKMQDGAEDANAKISNAMN